jgi:hypothetical protein
MALGPIPRRPDLRADDPGPVGTSPVWGVGVLFASIVVFTSVVFVLALIAVAVATLE